MSEAPLTHEEIQALVAGQTDGAGETGSDLVRLEEQLTAANADVASALAAKAGEAVTVGRPDVQRRTAEQIGADWPAVDHVVATAFSGGVSGAAALVFDADAAGRLGSAMPLQAIADEVFKALADRFSSAVGSEVTAAGAAAVTGGPGKDAFAAAGLTGEVIQAFTPLAVDGDPTGSWLLVLDGSLVSGLAGEQASAAAAAAVAALPEAPPVETPPAEAPTASAPVQAPAAAVAPVTAPAPAPAPAAVTPAAAVAPAQPLPAGEPVAVQPAAFGDVGHHSGHDGSMHNIELLMDVPLQMTVELGRTRRPIKDVLALGPGSIVELDRLAGEPVDVFANGQLVARGEVVVIDENFGVRITDIISPADRVRSL